MASNLARKSARRKQQTRLTFDPIDPDLRYSSPATNKSPANVRYHLPNQRHTPSSSTNTYAVEDEEESEDPLFSSRGSNVAKPRGMGTAKDSLLKALPTPVKSSQMLRKGSGSFDKAKTRSKATGSELDIDTLQSRGTWQIWAHIRSKNRQRPWVDLDESDGSPPEEEVQTPSKKAKGKRNTISWSQTRDLGHEEAISDTPELPKRSSRLTRKSTPKAKGRRQKSVTLSSDIDDNVAFPVPKQLQKRKPGRPKKTRPTIDDDSDDAPVTSSTRQSLSKAKSEKQAVLSEDDSSDEVIISSVNRRRPRASVQDDESDAEPISSPLKKRRLVVSDSGDSEIRSSPRKRKKYVNYDKDSDSDLPSIPNIVSSRKARSNSTSSSSTIIDRVTRKTKGRKHRTEREKKLELLKRKRAGDNIEELTDSDDSEESSKPKKGIYDSDSDLEILEEFEDESEPEVIQKPKKTKKSNLNSYHLSDESDFVVEDDEDGCIGVPLGLLDIPLQFRHAAHKPMKEHFKDAIEWMVHRKINPAFSRNDEIYMQAFTKLDDEYTGYAKSKFVSSQWTAEFTRAIYARPVLVERPCGPGEGYTIDGLPKCDVCNHRKHFPKFAIHFEGKAYYKSTLEEVEHQDDDEEANSDDDSNDETSVNSKGHSLPAEDKEWFSGIVCRDNAQQAHALIHWKYALNEWVVDQLETEGYLTPDQLAEREKMKAKKRREYANYLVDQWEESGIIKNLYRDFKSQLDAARESKQGRWG